MSLHLCAPSFHFGFVLRMDVLSCVLLQTLKIRICDSLRLLLFYFSDDWFITSTDK